MQHSHFLLQLQRDLGSKQSSVLEGRDIGTVVFPKASIKFFLTARPEVRARRRYEQLHKSVSESKQCKDILPVSGAGQDGTDELRKKYQKETPGQKVKSFTEYNMTK